MNKLRSQFGAALTRQQMKNVTGGDGPGSPPVYRYCKCTLTTTTIPLVLPSTTSDNWDTAEVCSAQCANLCANAPLCTSYEALYIGIN